MLPTPNLHSPYAPEQETLNLEAVSADNSVQHFPPFNTGAVVGNKGNDGHAVASGWTAAPAAGTVFFGYGTRD